VDTPYSVHSGNTLARNALLSFVAQATPLVVALVALPVLIRGLGTQRFGAFQLAWVILAYFAAFDLGLGRAASKFVAEYVARGERDAVRHAVTAAAGVQLVTALLGAGMLTAAVPTLVHHVLKVPPGLTGEVRRAFYLLAIALPAVLGASTYSGVLQAVQRFDLVTRVQVATSVLTYGLPLAVLQLGGGLGAVVGAVVAVRLLALVAYVALAYRAVPDLRGRLHFEWPTLTRMAAFGGWVSISNVASPLMLYLDRYVIGSVLGLAAVAYYTAPYDVIVRLTIVPASIVPPLFPAFSAFGGVGDTRRLTELFSRAAKYLALTMVPIAAALVALAPPGLAAWLGGDFARHATLPAQILAAGIMVNAMAQLPFAALQAVGRADLPAKFHLAELPCYVALLIFLVSHLGITGAALAWGARVTLDAVLLYWAALRHLAIDALLLLRRTAAQVTLPVVTFGAVVALAAAGGDGVLLRLGGTAVATVAGGLVAWRAALDDRERQVVRTLMRR
jgi:O-antigen/teichoic acid export membrane protein